MNHATGARPRVSHSKGWYYPMIAAAKALEGIDRLGLDAEARALFLGGNAARIFGL